MQQLRNGYTRPTTHHTIPRQSKQTYLQFYHQHQQQQAGFNPGQQKPHQQVVAVYPTSDMQYAFQNMGLVEMTASPTPQMLHKTGGGGSDSGSSIGSADSPPDTPGLVTSSSVVSNSNSGVSRAKQQLSLSNRLNKIQQGGSASGIYSSQSNSPQQTTNSNNNNNNINPSVNSNSNLNTTSNNNNNNEFSSNPSNLVTVNLAPSIIPAGTTTFSPAYHPHPSTVSSTVSVQGAPPTNRPVIPIPPFRHQATAPAGQAFQIQPNGELLYPVYLPPPTQTARSSPSAQNLPPPPTQTPPIMMPQTSAAYPSTKIMNSCFNCGSTSHSGRDCHEASMEDVTRNAIYKLDFTTTQQPPPTINTFGKQSASNASLSSMVSDGSSQMQQTGPGNSSATGNNSSSNVTGGGNFEQHSASEIIDLTQDTSSSSSSSVSSIGNK